VASAFGTLTALGFHDHNRDHGWSFCQMGSPREICWPTGGLPSLEGQQLMWGQQRDQPEIPLIHHTLFAHYQPNELGNNLPQRMVEGL